IKMEEPDRVPVWLTVGTYPAYYYGADFYTIMYDYDIMRKAWLKFMHDFGDMDIFSGPAFIPSGKISEALNSKVALVPGHGLPKDASMNQIVEGEYMMGDEYDAYLRDPSDFNVRVMTPRTTGLLECFKKLPPLRMLQGAGWVGVLSDPEIRKAFQTMIDLADEYQKWSNANRDIGNEVMSHGYPSFRGGVMAGAPFDHFADMLRGTRGISVDLRRQPKKLHEAMEYYTNLTINTQIKNFPVTDCPICIMPLHKGDDTFMSDAQFEEFYWPYLRRVLMAMIEEGLVPMPFAEGRFTKRLKFINDTPRSGVVWYFDQTDMAEAKKILGNTCCIMGNVPTSLVITSTPRQVKEYCIKLIRECAPGGGFILSPGASIDKGNLPNLKAMMEAAYEYGVYSKK
ncbi:MAG TPA: uroporphyrinogen decarboxylase family protein, partial [Dehalococcoidales bacterium]|nr:uroporphyrinogen decarboxylase family protein [Dehalococcoidales bacterium]